MPKAYDFTKQNLLPRAGTSAGPPFQFGGFGPFGASGRPFAGSSWGSAWPMTVAATASVTVTATVTTSARATSTPTATSSTSTDANVAANSKLASFSSSSFSETSTAFSGPGLRPPATSLSLATSSSITSTTDSSSALRTNDTSSGNVISNSSNRRNVVAAAVSSIFGAALLVVAIMLVWRCRYKRRIQNDSQRGDVDPFDARPGPVQDRPMDSSTSDPVDASVQPYRPEDVDKHDLEHGLSSNPTRHISLRTSTLSAGATVGVPHPSPILVSSSSLPQQIPTESLSRRVSLLHLRPMVLRQETDAGVRIVLSMESTGEAEGTWGAQSAVEETLPPPYDARFSA